MSSLRVALVASSYAPHIGGVEQHTAHVGEQLRARGHEVEVWTVARQGQSAVRVVDGVTVRELPTPLPARNLAAGLRFARSAPSALLRWLDAWRSFRPEVLHVQCFGPNGLYAYGLSAVTRTPLMISSHGETDADDNDVFRTSFLIPTGLRRAVQAAHAVTGCSASVVTDLHDNFGGQGVVVVPNGVEAIDLDAVGRQTGRVIGVGRLEHNKGFDLLMRAMALTDDSHLVLVGDGRQRQQLEALSVSLGISERVTFLGARSVEETRRAIADAEVLVMPSRKESFGIVALEAWSAGTPLVATSTCGPADFVTDGQDGLLVDPHDTAALAGTIEGLLEDNELRRRLAAAGSVRVQEYTWDSVVDRYLAIYREIGIGKSGAPVP